VGSAPSGVLIVAASALKPAHQQALALLRRMARHC